MYLYVLVDEKDSLIGIYDSEDLANQVKAPIEEKLKKTLKVERRTLNLPIDLVGVFK